MQSAEVTIHRGARQIGGCCTEISYGSERVLIDLGANLPGYKSGLSDEELISKAFEGRKINGLIFTHPHGDHYGLYKKVPGGCSDVYRLARAGDFEDTRLSA